MKQLTEKQKANLAAGRLKLQQKRDAVKPEVVPADSKFKMPKLNIRQIAILALAGVGIIFALFIGSLWLQNPQSPFTGVLAAMILAGSIYLALNARISTQKVSSIRFGQVKATGTVNSINIYAKKDPNAPGHWLPDKIEFAYEAKPPGLYRKVRNLGKYFYVNMYDSELKDVVMPDNQYCDPRRLLIPYLMKHSLEYYTPVPSLFQRIKPLLFLGGIGVGAFILLITTPPPGV